MKRIGYLTKVLITGLGIVDGHSDSNFSISAGTCDRLTLITSSSPSPALSGCPRYVRLHRCQILVGYKKIKSWSPRTLPILLSKIRWHLSQILPLMWHASSQPRPINNRVKVGSVFDSDKLPPLLSEMAIWLSYTIVCIIQIYLMMFSIKLNNYLYKVKVLLVILMP